jgi:hypothetical protein
MRNGLLLGIALTLAGCGAADAVTPPRPSVSGSYRLTSVDGHELPFTVVDLGTYKAQIAAGVLALEADGTYAMSFDITLDDGLKVRPATESDAGRWTASAETITLTSALDTVRRTGTVSGNVVTLQSSTRVFVLRK